ncbi:hypothetical protein Sfulv_49780 [Streptomyces fulvorobeus]|uniref:Uncharacterized protein n=1 Tax=Streptomyces fulvorobeus TaxID=284028 RepID=A0A7J0CD78_9ACTN|nr:hypothetical protein Sfulv_49780 [Streptomyces fulvorobeus]
MGGKLSAEPGERRAQLRHPRVVRAASGHPLLLHVPQQNTPPRTPLYRCIDQVPDGGQVPGIIRKLTASKVAGATPWAEWGVTPSGDVPFTCANGAAAPEQ